MMPFAPCYFDAFGVDIVVSTSDTKQLLLFFTMFLRQFSVRLFYFAFLGYLGCVCLIVLYVRMACVKVLEATSR